VECGTERGEIGGAETLDWSAEKDDGLAVGILPDANALELSKLVGDVKRVVLRLKKGAGLRAKDRVPELRLCCGDPTLSGMLAENSDRIAFTAAAERVVLCGELPEGTQVEGRADLRVAIGGASGR
jgi:hypothetical protein